MDLFKSIWKIASTVATIITIKNQLQTLSNAPKELQALATEFPSLNNIVAGDTPPESIKWDKWDSGYTTGPVVEPMKDTQHFQLTSGV